MGASHGHSVIDKKNHIEKRQNSIEIYMNIKEKKNKKCVYQNRVETVHDKIT